MNVKPGQIWRKHVGNYKYVYFCITKLIETGVDHPEVFWECIMLETGRENVMWFHPKCDDLVSDVN